MNQTVELKVIQNVKKNILDNGDFSNGTTSWVLGSGWSIIDHKAVCPAFSGNLTYGNPSGIFTIATDHDYVMVIEVVDFVSGSMKVTFGSDNAQTFTGNGKKVLYLNSTTSNTNFLFGPILGSFVGSINSVELYYAEDYTNETVGYLDLYDNTEIISLNYAIADIRDITKRDSSYSKTITIPGTANNNKFFESAFELGNNYTRFDPLHKIFIQVLVDGNINFQGYMQLNSVKKNKDLFIEYEVTLFGQLSNVKVDLDKLYLTDLDISEYNHERCIENVIASWDNYIIKNGNTQPVYPGIGYRYPLERRKGPLNTTWNVLDFYPAVYTKTIWDKIWAAQGITIESEFLNGEYFRNLEHPFCNDGLFLSSAQLEERKFVATQLTTRINVESVREVTFQNAGGTNFDQILFTQLSSFYPKTIILNNDTVAPGQDTSNQYNTVTGVFTCGKSGIYNVNATFLVRTSFTPVNGTDNWYLSMPALIPRPLPVPPNQSSNGLDPGWLVQARIKRLSDGAIVSTSSLDNVVFPGTRSNLGTYVTTNTLVCTPVNLNLTAGETYGLELVVLKLFTAFQVLYNTNGNANYNPPPNPPNGMTFSIDVDTDSIFYAEASSSVTPEFEDIEMNQCLPENIKQSDYIDSISKMFNLLYEPHPTIPNRLIVEPREDFYNGIVDWSKKRDLQQELEIFPVAELDTQNYIFRYAEDTDLLNAKYNNDYKPVRYGDRTVTIDDDFVTNTQTIELLFSPTPSSETVGTDLVTPWWVDATGNGQIPKIRIHSGNLVDCTTPWTITNTIRGSYPATQETQHFDGGSSSNHHPQHYPYAGHFDHPETPTTDLNWGIARTYYWDFNTITDGNIFNRYYRNFLDEITDINSHLLKCYVYLNPVDMRDFSFRNLVFIDNVYYRVNKIVDYNPITEEPTAVELFKAKNSSLFVPTERNPDEEGDGEGPDDSGNNQINGRQSNPNRSGLGPQLKAGSNFFQENSNLEVLGTLNTAQTGATGLIVGDDNHIGAMKSTIVVGDGNSVTSSIENVVLLNVNGAVVTQSNYMNLGEAATVINGQWMFTLDVVDGGEDTVQDLYGDSIIDTIDGGEDELRAFPIGDSTTTTVEGNL